MNDEPENEEVNRELAVDVELAPDSERDVVEGELDDGLPSRLDASFEEPVPDAIDQRREVLLESDGYEA